MKRPLLLPMLAASLCTPAIAQPENEDIPDKLDPKTDYDLEIDSIEYVTDVAWFDQWQEAKSVELVEADYHDAAKELGVDVATIYAVIEIEAGSNGRGFWSDGKPLICFSTKLFCDYSQKRGIKVSKYAKTHSVVFDKLNISRFGSHQAAHQAKFDAATDIDTNTAIESTFWGMFQIAGFNWKRCGMASPQEFAEKMQRSERDQLDLFINFLRNTGLDKPLQKRDWTAFARGYNGKSYAKNNYHTRLANSYKKHK